MNLNRFQFCLLVSVVFFTTVFCGGQDFPDEIRGYKVHRVKITVRNEGATRDQKDDSEAFARLSEPRLVSTSLTGLTFEMTTSVDPLPYKGRVDFLDFSDFKVNGLAVSVEEFRESFEFKKKKPITIPQPIRIFVPAGQALRGALGEIRDSRDEWRVTGTVFVFGRFKKWGFNIKRVVPVAIDVTIRNPIRDRVKLPFPVAN